MTVNDLVRNYKEHNPKGHFFDRDTLKFFGETLRTMNVSSETKHVIDYGGKPHECYVLESLQKNNPLGPTYTTHYFDVVNFKDIPVYSVEGNCV